MLLRGKGRKERVVPIPDDLAKALTALMSERGVDRQETRTLFVGLPETRLTRFGATHIVRRTAATAAVGRPELARKSISPHIFRHSLAMTLLQSSVDLLTIQAWRGHAQVATTHRYAAADVEMMRRGLDKAGISGNQTTRFRPKDAVLHLLENL
ncbi:tyrosine-type recombinase/integrase [Aurantimonas sp. C2-6-R+9]|uniref:tyrosine-type recombinase/integrase n=1 Tax=unclassified Aurantimonas TaxID=2638230 RepID=UPI002E17677B|nr:MULTISPECIES: tyrosine-type recombinase/integrase [unclassified Aurantimonas]MEC5293435.1 tyrosine-type recombinase/integrase [Aurantimonas sp. C2-3-R2]MEC5383632.1 tyrosine-type recombinase/integrase [Aurantimonas sp. C2-6-R+9]MEC5414522.1 tyrosine-type recombinase/integrase [Aurantimonas sp. C2-4-R8]